MSPSLEIPISPRNPRLVKYYAYRDYDAVSGRWTGRDPIAEQGGINLYGMVGSAVCQTISSRRRKRKLESLMLLLPVKASLGMYSETKRGNSLVLTAEHGLKLISTTAEATEGANGFSIRMTANCSTLATNTRHSNRSETDDE